MLFRSPSILTIFSFLTTSRSALRRTISELAEGLAKTRQLRFEACQRLARRIKVSFSAPELKLMDCLRRILGREVADRTFQRVCRPCQRPGVAALYCFVNFGKTLWVIGQKEADKVSKKAVATIDARQERGAIDYAVSMINSRANQICRN